MVPLSQIVFYVGLSFLELCFSDLVRMVFGCPSREKEPAELCPGSTLLHSSRNKTKQSFHFGILSLIFLYKTFCWQLHTQHTNREVKEQERHKTESLKKSTINENIEYSPRFKTRPMLDSQWKPHTTPQNRGKAVARLGDLSFQEYNPSRLRLGKIFLFLDPEFYTVKSCYLKTIAKSRPRIHGIY